MPETTVHKVLRVRQERLTTVLHLVSGRVQLGIREDGQMRHQLGVVEGPFWLDGAAAMLNMPCAVDMVTETRVQLRRQPIEDSMRSVEALPKAAPKISTFDVMIVLPSAGTLHAR